jgi:Abnormal spindle-like microcephaly-assoc'd, ASPM-SPD-2-Hydin
MRSNYRLAAWECAVVSAVLGFSNLLAAQPTVKLSPTSLSFGDQMVDVSSTAQVVTVTNTGTTTLLLSNIRISGGNHIDFSQTNTCGSSLGANASCTISVVFTPSKTGSRTSTVSISDNATGSPQSVALSGTGVAPTVTLSPASLSFGGVLVGKSSATQSVTVSNSGTAPLTVSDFDTTGDFSQTNNCTAAPVPVGSSCTITVTFSPTAAWSRGGSIAITDNAYNDPQQVLLLVGMGNSGAAASVSPTSLSFGNQTLGTSSSAKTITLSNTGSAALNINSILATGDYSQTNNCPASLSAGTNCTINVTFAPSNTGSRTGDITVNDTAPAFLQTTSLSGTGVVASSAVSVSPVQGSITPIQTEQFSATVNGVTSTNVTWSVDGVQGGNSTVGTISTSGLYIPPTTSASHIIQATNNANSSQTAVAFLAVNNYAGTFTMKNDTLRTGQNLNEIALTTGNVNQNQFGKLFTRTVDGNIYAQPLYVPNVATSAGTYNVVYVATENDSVYAFDADGTATSPLWQTSFLTGGAQPLDTTDVNCTNITPVYGITSTPVIDPATNTMFVLARTKTGTAGNYTYYQTLYAVDIVTGAILQSVQVQASVSNHTKTINFNTLTQNQRAGLLLANGVVYIAWASHCDNEPYYGWVIGYNETTFQQSGVFNTTPDGVEGGIWQGGGALAADANGNIFLTTANGTYDASMGGEDYGDSVLKLTATGGVLSVGDSFTPWNQANLSSLDWDLGAGGTMLLPDQAGSYPHVMLAGGKGSSVYELNRDSLGGFSTNLDQNLLTVPAAIGADVIGSGSRSAGPAYWQEQVYYTGSNSFPQQFSIQNSLISTVPIAQSNKHFQYPGGSPVVSANGNNNGIVWIIETDKFGNNGNAILRAFDAANVSRELYDTTQNSTRDAAGPAVKFTAPTVANGKVYVGTQTELNVYGLLP